MEKPELIVFSQNLVGGGASFHRNMLSNAPANHIFEIKCIYHDPLHWIAKRSTEINLNPQDVIFQFSDETEKAISLRLNHHISNRPGAIVTNLVEELYTLEKFPKSKKTIFFICHDGGYLNLAQRFNHIIDQFIAHNSEIYEHLLTMLPKRRNDIHYISHGVSVQENHGKKRDLILKLVFLARHVKSKGIYDLPVINQILADHHINVAWTILGDGEERENFKKLVADQENFSFYFPSNTHEIISLLRDQDLFILPSVHDGLPVAMLEAMSVGCVPIIYNFNEGIKNVVTADIGYVVEKENPNLIAEKIIYLHNNRESLKSMSNACIDSIEQNFDISKQANKYFELYQNYKILKRRDAIQFKTYWHRFKKSKFAEVVRIVKKKYENLNS